jgi:hypothetical protein
MIMKVRKNKRAFKPRLRCAAWTIRDDVATGPGGRLEVVPKF